MAYKSKLSSILQLYNTNLIKLEQKMGQMTARRQEITEKLAFERRKEEALLDLIRNGEGEGGFFFAGNSSEAYEERLKDELEEIYKALEELRQEHAALTKKKEWVVDEDSRRALEYHKEELKKEERLAQEEREEEWNP
jgi:hypothetical protein